MIEVYKGFEIEIEQDECPESPREWDNVGEIIAKHRDYDLADKDARINAKDYDNMEDLITEAKKQGAEVIKPLYILDHSGLWLSTGTFDCDSQGWDTSLVGIIVAFRDDILKEYGTKRISKSILKNVENVLVGEVGTYSKYLSGDIVGYNVENKEGENIAGCWGFYDIKDLMEDATGAIDFYIKEEEEKKEKKLKGYIKNNVPLQLRWR
jgi:hypothetical protein